MRADVTTVIFIGDELTATGFRLAGVETIVPEPDAVRDALLKARTRAELVLLTADCARRIPVGELEEILSVEMPIVAVIPDILRHTLPLDLSRRLRATLGIES